MPARIDPIPNKVFVGVPWHQVKPRYERCIDVLRTTSPLYFHIVGRSDRQNAEDLLLRIKTALDSSSSAIFDATWGNPNVSLEFGYAEARDIEKALYLSDHKAATRSTGFPIISDLAGKTQNRYKTEKKLLALLRTFSSQHPYGKRFDQAMKKLCRGKRGPEVRRIRAMALRVIHFLDGESSRRRQDLVEYLKGEEYELWGINWMITNLRKAKLIDSHQGPASKVWIQ